MCGWLHLRDRSNAPRKEDSLDGPEFGPQNADILKSEEEKARMKAAKIWCGRHFLSYP